MFYSHKSSIIDKNVEIGDGTKIWHWTHISEGARIGKNCILGQNIFVGQDVIIGDNVKIQNNVSIYKGVKIENDVFCGPSVVFTNVINPRSFIEKKTEFQKTLIKIGVSIGANTTIICGNTLGQYSFIGAGSLVTKDVKNYSISYGSPCKHKGWISIDGSKLNLPIKGKGEAICSISGLRYQLIKNQVFQK